MAATSAAPGKAWTPDYVAFLVDATAEQVLREEGLFHGATWESRVEWAWVQTAQRLAWLYGCAGAAERLNGYGLCAGAS